MHTDEKITKQKNAMLAFFVNLYLGSGEKETFKLMNVYGNFLFSNSGLSPHEPTHFIISGMCV
jgi:hypothetical protein